MYDMVENDANVVVMVVVDSQRGYQRKPIRPRRRQHRPPLRRKLARTILRRQPPMAPPPQDIKNAKHTRPKNRIRVI